MPHIHTLPGQYDLTVSAYIIRTDGPEPKIVMHKHKILGKYLQFGGHVELNEDPWQAVVHETLEESGYQMSQLKLLQPDIPQAKVSFGVIHPHSVATISVQFGDTDHNHTDIAYAFTANSPPNKPLGKNESSEIKLFTRQELAALSDEQIPVNAREIGLYIFDECLPHWKAVDTAIFSE